MNIPENGRVVVIDDIIEEGLPLVISLAKQNIPVIYFSGKKEELPVKPLTGIRVVFLDIVLGTDGQSPKTQIAAASRIFKSIIDANNGPYLLIAWTKHDEHIDNIKNELSDRPPSCFLDLEKSKCKNEDGSFSLAKIEKKIRRELRKIKSFHLFTLWENILHQAAGETVNDFSSFYSIDDKWDRNISSVFFHLAKAYAGKKSETMIHREIVKNALLTLNGAFIDSVENRMKNNLITITSIDRSAIQPQIQARINNKLLLFLNKDIKGSQPGNIYRVTNRFGTKVDLTELFEDGKLSIYQEKDDLISKIRYVFLEVSPVCDYAQDKLRVHRCLPGVVWPQDHCRKIKKKAEFIYTTPLFEIDGKLSKLVFDLRYLMAIPIAELSSRKAVFRIRHDMLVDIQSHIARHINRPGIIFIG
jgi:hypothetical protein